MSENGDSIEQRESNHDLLVNAVTRKRSDGTKFSDGAVRIIASLGNDLGLVWRFRNPTDRNDKALQAAVSFVEVLEDLGQKPLIYKVGEITAKELADK